MRRWRMVLAIGLAGIAGLVSAVGVSALGSGATTIGDTNDVSPSTSSGPAVFVQAVDPSGATFAVPAGGGVITQWYAKIWSASASAPITLEVVHQGSPTASSVYPEVVSGADTETVPVVTSPIVETYPARIPVAAGDRLGVSLPAAVHIQSSGFSPVDSADLVDDPNVQPTVGQTFTTQEFAFSSHLELAADVEPDADHDGYGDLTQDQCLNDPAHAPPCAADLAASASAHPGSVSAGSLALIEAGASIVSGKPTNARVSITVPAGLQVVSADGTGGSCTGSGPLTCPVGDLGGVALIVVQTKSPGAFPFLATAGSDGSDGNLGNNSATTTLTVKAVSVPTVIKQCTVPPLAGLTETKATSLLKTFGCARGKVTKLAVPKSKRTHGRKVRFVVRSSSPKLGTRARLGTKVKLTLRAK